MNLVKARTAPFNSIFSDRTALYFVEQLSIQIPFEIFQKMANGKDVIVKTGVSESKLQKGHLTKLRELAARLRVSA